MNNYTCTYYSTIFVILSCNTRSFVKIQAPVPPESLRITAIFSSYISNALYLLLLYQVTFLYVNNFVLIIFSWQTLDLQKIDSHEGIAQKSTHVQ